MNQQQSGSSHVPSSKSNRGAHQNRQISATNRNQRDGGEAALKSSGPRQQQRRGKFIQGQQMRMPKGHHYTCYIFN